MLSSERLYQLKTVYRDGLLQDTLPFWIRHAVDREEGGFLFCLDRDGSVIDTDKGMWQQCRFTWLLATLYNTVEQRKEWLDLARHGVRFIRRHGFDQDGRMFFHVARDGRPVRKRRYIFTECFGAQALAAYSRAAKDLTARKEAEELFQLIRRVLATPGLIPSKHSRSMKSLAIPMILLGTAQTLRDAFNDPIYLSWIDEAIQEIETMFMKPDLRAVLETVGPKGEFMDHFDGRILNPGHSLEAAWFILHEARVRGNDPALVKMGSAILDWMWRFGWDEEYGGILYYIDVKGHPVQEYWHDMKFWWPQNEAIIATLLAYALTGNTQYAERHTLIHDWAYSRFPDPEHGEWYGYLHRDGRVSVPLKGNLWKGPYHLPRMQLYCWQLLEEMERS